MGKQIIKNIFKSFLAIFGVVGIIYAAQVAQFSAGETLTATKMNELVNRINSLESSSGSAPSGAVMSFDLEACPIGWTEYTPAYGRVIRGIDKSGTNIDADGERILGSIQEDAIRNITGTLDDVDINDSINYTGLFSTTKNAKGAGAGAYSTTGVFDVYFDASLVVPTADENRMKNVALLYCRKD